MKVLGYSWQLNYHYLVLLDWFSLFLPFLLPLIKLFLWLKFSQRQKGRQKTRHGKDHRDLLFPNQLYWNRAINGNQISRNRVTKILEYLRYCNLRVSSLLTHWTARSACNSGVVMSGDDISGYLCLLLCAVKIAAFSIGDKATLHLTHSFRGGMCVSLLLRIVWCSLLELRTKQFPLMLLRHLESTLPSSKFRTRRRNVTIQ